MNVPKTLASEVHASTPMVDTTVSMELHDVSYLQW